jgi:hypothetical protein
MSLTMPNADLTLTAKWQANPFTLYVKHFKMDLDGNYPVIATET